MLSGPYNSHRWLNRLLEIESLSVIAGFFFSCYFLLKAGWVFFSAGAFLKLALLVLGVCVFGAVLRYLSAIWRLVALGVFALCSPLFEHLLG